jgi:hypothetical protein
MCCAVLCSCVCVCVCLCVCVQVSNTQLLRRVFARALHLFALRAELTRTDYRLLRFAVLGWAEVARQARAARLRGDANRRALLFRGVNLLTRAFLAWSLRASRRRRREEARQRYTALLFRTSFFLWAEAAREGARRRRAGGVMRAHRLLGAALGEWRGLVQLQCVELPGRAIAVLRLRGLWDHWRTRGRAGLARRGVQADRWRLKRTEPWFAAWTALYRRKLRLRAASRRLALCRARLAQRCCLLRWDGWRQERAAAALRATQLERRTKFICSDTIGGPLARTWEQHILAHRWRKGQGQGQGQEEGDYATSEEDEDQADDGPLGEKENGGKAAPEALSAGNVRASLEYLFSADVGVATASHRQKSHPQPQPQPAGPAASRAGAGAGASGGAAGRQQGVAGGGVMRPLRADLHPDRGGRGRGRGRGNVAPSSGSASEKHGGMSLRPKAKSSHPPRSPVIDRALVLGYCSFRAESHAPLMRFLKAVFRALKKFVKKRRHCYRAYIYYRNNKHYGAVASVFHLWMSKVPELGHRSSSWLYPTTTPSPTPTIQQPVPRQPSTHPQLQAQAGSEEEEGHGYI